MSDGLSRSADAADVRIREIASGSSFALRDADAVRRRVAVAPFAFLTLTQHVLKRINEQQWSAGTTEDEYLAQLRAGAGAAKSVVVCTARGGSIALLVAATETAVPPFARGASTEPLLAVVFSADRGSIITGYQVSSLARLRIPVDAIWLLRQGL